MPGKVRSTLCDTPRGDKRRLDEDQDQVPHHCPEEHSRVWHSARSIAKWKKGRRTHLVVSVSRQLCSSQRD